MHVKIRRHQHTRVHAHTGPRRHARAPAGRRHHIPRLVRRQAFDTRKEGSLDCELDFGPLDGRNTRGGACGSPLGKVHAERGLGLTPPG